MKEQQPKTPVNEDYKYQVLVPDAYHTALPTPEKLQELYMSNTTKLVHEICKNDYETVVFLDKSARPLAWMMRELWPHIAPQTENPDTGEYETAKMPDIRFVNIDRLKWRQNSSVPIEDGGMKESTNDDIDGLRSIFHVNSTDTIDYKKVLIVDEQSETGDTLKAAKRLFSEGFPDSDIATYAWIRASKVGGHAKVTEIPVWYPAKNAQKGLYPIEGRGIYDPDPDKDPTSSRLPRSAMQFLGAPPRVERPVKDLTDDEKEEFDKLQVMLKQSTDSNQKKQINSQIKTLKQGEYDPKSMALREDIKHMVADFIGGKLMPLVITDRPNIAGLPREEYHAKRLEHLKSQRFKR